MERRSRKVKMKNYLITICLLVLVSCNRNTFDLIKARQIENISKDDLNTYKTLSLYIQDDMDTIKTMSMTLIAEGMDTTYLLTNSYYLSKIDSVKYTDLIKKLAGQGIFKDYIQYSNKKGIIKYRIKENTDNNIAYIHELIYTSGNYFNPTEYEVIIDSIISPTWRYLFYKANIGH